MKMLFIDELIRSPKINGEHAETRNHLQQSRAFLVQNILPTVPEDIDYSHLPRLAPPYETCWFEWTTAVNKRDDVPEDFSGELDEQLVYLKAEMEHSAARGRENGTPLPRTVIVIDDYDLAGEMLAAS